MKHRGFTLIELLACLALSGLLLTVLLQLSVSVVRSERRVAAASEYAATDWREAIHRRMQRDLDQALLVRIRRGALEMEGWCGTDQTMQAHHDPVRVVYRVVQDVRGGSDMIGGTPYLGLVREQTLLNQATIHPPERALVGLGVAGWRRIDPQTLALRWAGSDGGEIWLRLPRATEGLATP